jgi:hypothetical protein
VYVSFRRRAPRRGSIIATPEGQGRVTDLLVPIESVMVDLGDGRSATYALTDLDLPTPEKE